MRLLRRSNRFGKMTQELERRVYLKANYHLGRVTARCPLDMVWTMYLSIERTPARPASDPAVSFTP